MDNSGLIVFRGKVLLRGMKTQGKEMRAYSESFHIGPILEAGRPRLICDEKVWLPGISKYGLYMDGCDVARGGTPFPRCRQGSNANPIQMHLGQIFPWIFITGLLGSSTTMQ